MERNAQRRNPFARTRAALPQALSTLALAVLFVSSPLARGQTFWVGGSGNWSNPAKWSNGVPGSGSHAFIGGPYLDVDATIGSLTFQKGAPDAPLGSCGFAPCISDNRNPRTLIVQNTTTFEDISGGSSGPSGVRLGFTITAIMGSNFQLGTTNLPPGVLVGQWSVEDWDGTESATPALIQFRDADVRENRASVWLQGPDAAIRDQNTGANAFRNLTTNNFEFFLADGNVQSTSGPLTNNDDLYLFNFGEGAPTRLTVGGKLTNNTAGYIQIQGGGQVTVTGDFHNRGGRSVPSDPQFGGVSLVNGTRTVGDTILNVHGNLTNDHGAEIYVSGNPNVSRLIVAGNLTTAGLLQLEGAGSVEVAGTLSVTGTGQMIIDDDSSSQLSAGQIHLGQDTEFDAQGTIYSIVVGSGVFATSTSSSGEVTINGSLTLTDTARLQMQIGGRTPGPGPSGYDQIRHVTPTPPSPGSVPNGAVPTGGVVLDGTLNVSLLNGFEPMITPQDTFTILTSDRMLTGAFNNVASGGTVKARNGSGAFNVTYNGNSVVLSNYTATPLMLAAAVSRKVHGATGTFDLPLSLVTPATVESRRGAVATDHQLWFTFTNAIASGNATVTAGTATIAGTPQIVGNSIGINLTGVSDQQKITITLSDVTDTLGQVLPSTAVSMGVLLGDSNGDGTVNSGDATQTRTRSGQAASLTNFRSDVNSDGTINTGDALIVRGRSGNFLP